MSQPIFVLASVLFGCRLLLLIALHVVPGGVHPVRDTVSDYAVADSRTTRTLATVSSWSAAAAWAALGAGVLIDESLGESRLGVGGWLLVLGCLLAAMPFVPTDRTGSSTTAGGRVHLLFAVAWFTLGYSTIGPLGRLLVGAPGAVLGVLDPIAAVALAALVVSLLARPLRPRTFGLAERAFILVVTVAPLIASVGLAATGSGR